MPNISSITHVGLKVIFAIHLVLVTWSVQGLWCPKSVMFYNLLFFVCILWASHHNESDEPVQYALLINVLSIFLDVITLAIYFPTLYGGEKFSAAIMIINLIARVITSVSLMRIGQARGGSLATMFSQSPAMGVGRQDYEDISQSIPQSSGFAGI
ncbi:type-1 angiotensin II receptor-associated protein isoform X2 [Augochlora pura]